MKVNKRKKKDGLLSVPNTIKALLLFGLITGFSACQDSVVTDEKEQIENSQKQPDYDDMMGLVRYSPFSKNNNNFLVLNPQAYPKADGFIVEVQTSEKMENGNYEFVTVWEGKMTPKQPYVRIPEEFKTKNEVKYALMITVLDGSGKAMAKGPVPTSVEPMGLAQPSPPQYFHSMVTCNGPDYAYNLASFTDYETNPTKYKIEMVSQRWSPEPNETGELEIHYYEYMSETQFSAWEQLNPPVAHWGGEPQYQVDVLFPGELPPGDYYDSQNNVIQGPVYAVEKGFGQWKGDGSVGEGRLSSPYQPHSDLSNWNGFGANFTYNNAQDLIFFSSKINSDIVSSDSRYGIDLVCLQVNDNGSHYGGGGSGTSPSVNEASLIYQDCLGNIISSGDGTADQNSDNVIEITGCGNEGEEGENGGIGGVDGGFGVYSVSFSKIDNPTETEPVILHPERFKGEGYTYSLQKGLYNVKVVTEDKTVIRYLKKVNRDEKHSYDPARGVR